MPEGFDFEPFQVTLQKFIQSDIQIRKTLCDFFENHKKQIMQLFVKENFELKQSRDVDFDELFDFILNILKLNIE